MIYEIEDDTCNLNSVYKKDYDKKKIRNIFKAKPFYPQNIESNCISDAYKEHIITQQKNECLPPRLRTESLTDFYNKVRSERPYLKKFLPDLLDEAVIDREQNKLLKTDYQLNFSKNLDGHDSLKEKEPIKITLPTNFSIAETTQKKFFRDPRYFSSTNVKEKKINARPLDNLRVNEKERKILEVRTGNSEYQEIIGKLGQQIIKEQFYGPTIPIEVPKEHIHGQNSERSVCSEILMDASKKHVLSQII